MNQTTLDPIVLSLSSPIIISIDNINFFVGLPLNIYVAVLLTRDGGLDGSLIFTLNQIAVEILFAIPAPLFILCYVNVEHLCFNFPIEFIISSCMSSRFLFQCCVCLERYMAVVHPVTFQKFKTTKNRLIISGCVWMYAFVYSIASTFQISELPLNIFGIFGFVTVSVMLFCSFSLLRGLRRPGPGARDDGSMSVAKRKAFKVVCLNLLIFFLFQTVPVCVIFTVRNMLCDYAFSLAFTIALNVTVSISLIQPVIFLYQNGKLTRVRRG